MRASRRHWKWTSSDIRGWAGGFFNRNAVYNCVAAGDDQAGGGEIGLAAGAIGLKKNSANVALQMVDANQRLVKRKRQRLAIGQPDQERPHQPRSTCHPHCVHVAKGELGPVECLTNHRYDAPQMFARSQFRHNTAILAVMSI